MQKRGGGMRKIHLSLLLLLGGCGATSSPDAKIERQCGVIACITSPYLQAKGGSNVIGLPIAAAISKMGSAPTSSVDLGNGSTLMSWNRTQTSNDFGTLSCTENITVMNGVVTDYSGKGHC